MQRSSRKKTNRTQFPLRQPNAKAILLTAAIFLLSALQKSTAASNDAPTLVQTLLGRYAKIASLMCDVRRDVTTPDGSIRWLSRVYFQQGNHLHAANARPQPRLILADGSTMYQHIADAPRGFRRAIADLDDNMRINLERIPGTLMEHLIRLKDIPEIKLEPSTEAAIRRAYKTEHVYAILEADEQYRLHRMLFYNAQDQTQKTGKIRCESFQEVLPGVWIAMQHHATFYMGENTLQERTRFTNYEVNIPIPEDTFSPDAHYADDIEWVDSFDQL